MATSRIYDYGTVMKLLEHSVIALVLQAIIGLVTGDWWIGMDPRVWNIKSLLDFILPSIACVAVAVALK